MWSSPSLSHRLGTRARTGEIWPAGEAIGPLLHSEMEWLFSTLCSVDQRIGHLIWVWGPEMRSLDALGSEHPSL